MKKIKTKTDNCKGGLQIMDIRLKEFLHNIKDHDYDVCGQYKIDKNEADKVIRQLERLDGYSDWNLTKNKLPKDEEYVLCVLETGKQAVMMIVEDEGGIFFWSEDFPQDSYSADQVIFWKPLDRVCGVDTYNTEEFEKLKNKLMENK